MCNDPFAFLSRIGFDCYILFFFCLFISLAFKTSSWRWWWKDLCLFSQQLFCIWKQRNHCMDLAFGLQMQPWYCPSSWRSWQGHLNSSVSLIISCCCIALNLHLSFFSRINVYWKIENSLDFCTTRVYITLCEWIKVKWYNLLLASIYTIYSNKMMKNWWVSLKNWHHLSSFSGFVRILTVLKLRKEYYRKRKNRTYIKLCKTEKTDTKTNT